MSGVSDWTLEHAFWERFGITLKAYILSYRLNWVHIGDQVVITWFVTMLRHVIQLGFGTLRAFHLII